MFPRPLTPCKDPPAQEQQGNAPHATYPSYVLQNAMVSFQHQCILSSTNAHSSLCLPPQVPPAPANGEPEGHREDIPPPVRGVAEPGRMQDPMHFDVAYQGVVDYHHQPLVGVSNSHLLTAEPPYQRRSGNRTPYMYSPI